MEPVNGHVERHLPTPREHNTALRQFAANWQATLYINDSQIVTLPNGLQIIQGDGAGHLKSFFRWGVSSTEALQTQIKSLIERHIAIYKSYTEKEIETLSDEDFGLFVENHTHLLQILKIAKEKFFNQDKIPVPTAPEDHFKRVFEDYVDRKFHTITYEQREHIANCLENGLPTDDPAEIELLKILPLVSKFMKVYNVVPDQFSKLSNVLKQWDAWHNRNLSVERMLNRLQLLDQSELVLLQQSIPPARLEKFLVTNQRSEASLEAFWKAGQNDFAEQFLRKRERLITPRLSPQRLVELIALGNLVYMPDLTAEQFIGLMPFHAQWLRIRQLPSWNDKTWKQVWSNPAFWASPHVQALFHQDKYFYRNVKDSFGEIQNPDHQRIVLEYAFRKGDRDLPEFNLERTKAFLTHEKPSIEAKKWIFAEALKGAAALELNQLPPETIIRYAPPQPLRNLKSYAEQSGDELRAALGPFEHWDMSNTNLAHLLPLLYPNTNFAILKNGHLAIPGMSLQQFQRYVSLNPPAASESDIRSVLRAIDAEQNSTLLAEVMKNYRFTALELFGQSHPSMVYLVAFIKSIPFIPLNFIPLNAHYKLHCLNLLIEYQKEYRNLFKLAEEIKLEPEILGHLFSLIDDDNTIWNHLINMFRNSNPKEKVYLEEVLTHLLGKFADRFEALWTEWLQPIEAIFNGRPFSEYPQLAAEEQKTLRDLVVNVETRSNRYRYQWTSASELTRLLPQDLIPLNKSLRQRTLDRMQALCAKNQSLVALLNVTRRPPAPAPAAVKQPSGRLYAMNDLGGLGFLHMVGISEQFIGMLPAMRIHNVGDLKKFYLLNPSTTKDELKANIIRWITWYPTAVLPGFSDSSIGDAWLEYQGYVQVHGARIMLVRPEH